MKKSYFAAAIIAFIAIILTGCSTDPPAENPVIPNVPSGTVKMTVFLPSGFIMKRSVSEIVSLKATITGVGMTEISKLLVLSSVTHSAIGTILVPAGAARRFSIDALDIAGTVIYSGSVESDVVANATTDLQVVLKPTLGSVDLEIILHTGDPALVVTYQPPIGSFKWVEGTIAGGVHPDRLALAPYIRGAAGGWWNKPLFEQPKVIPNSDGTWKFNYTTGMNDENSPEIVIYLIWRDTAIPNAGGRPTLPDIPGKLDTYRKLR